MNGAIAKKINDDYLVRCAQILNNKSRISKINEKTSNGKRLELITIRADGIKISDGTILPIEDGFNTIVICKNGNIYTINLEGTDYTINLSADSNVHYFRCKPLGIEYKHACSYLDEDYNIEKAYIHYKRPQCTIDTLYAVHSSDLLEPIYYYEELEGHKGEPQIVNAIINERLAKQSNKVILSHMQEIYEEYKESITEEEQYKIEDAMLDYYKANFDKMPSEEIPEGIKEKLNMDTENKNSVEPKSIGNVNKKPYESLLNSSIYASTFDIDDIRYIPTLCERVYDAYSSLYKEILDSEGIDYFVDHDMFEERLDMSDEEITDYDYYLDEGDTYEDVDTEIEYIEDLQDSLNDEFEEIDDVQDSAKLSSDEEKFIKRFSIYTKDCGTGEKIEHDDIPDAFKFEILQRISDYTMQKDFELSDLNSLIEAIDGVIQEIEDELEKARGQQSRSL